METTPPAAPPAPPISGGRPTRERKQVEVFKPPTEVERKKEVSVIEGAGMTLSEYAYFNDQWVSNIVKAPTHLHSCISSYISNIG